jgi:uncharacterized membrane protein YhhN
MLWILFILVSCMHLMCIHFASSPADLITKALLMPLAAWALYQQTKAQTIYVRWVIAGLLFGWLGDLLLHFQGFGYFIGGLSAFLLGHFCYITAFSKEVSLNKKVHYLMEKPYILLPYLGFFAYIVSTMSPSMDQAIKLPVFLYCFVILLMSLMAVNRFHPAGKRSWLLVLSGSLFFVASDYVLAINKFVHEVPYARYIIMSTYMAGQGLIAYGVAIRYRVHQS